MIHELNSINTDGLIAESVLLSAATLIEAPVSIKGGSAVRLSIGILWAAAGNASLEINNTGGSTGINSRFISGYAGGPASAESFAAPAGVFTGGDASGQTFTAADLALIGTRLMVTGQSVRSYSTGHLLCFSLFGPTGVSSINHLLVRSSVANAFSAGSFLRVYK